MKKKNDGYNVWCCQLNMWCWVLMEYYCLSIFYLPAPTFTPDSEWPQQPAPAAWMWSVVCRYVTHPPHLSTCLLVAVYRYKTRTHILSLLSHGQQVVVSDHNQEQRKIRMQRTFWCQAALIAVATPLSHPITNSLVENWCYPILAQHIYGVMW